MLRSLAHTTGLIVVSTVAALQIFTVQHALEGVVKKDALNAVKHPVTLQLLLFGIAYASMGDMTVSLAFSTGVVVAVRHAFVTDATIARAYFTDDFVTSVRRSFGEEE